ncbi:MAG: GNAT family N-acetyltransferase [Myxococcota bacterium]|nr:GNAT family N-acetyltransferase [Myxococcota bacterium]
MAELRSVEPFSEKGFYLAEFRGRTLAVAAPPEQLASPAPLRDLLDELAANGTRVALITSEREVAEALVGVAVDVGSPRFEGAVWRALARAPHVGVVAPDGDAFPRVSAEVALRLGIGKVVLVDSAGGLPRAGGGLTSFVDLAELRRLLRDDPPAEPDRAGLLREIEMALSAGVGAVNLCTLEGLADELFTYTGSGTLFTRERYVVVRRLGIDDYDQADHLIARGVKEGYLAPRSPEEIERVLAAGFGAFVEGHHLAGIGALLEHTKERAGEIVSLYTLTRFLGEGVGGHLVRFAIQRAREHGLDYLFACTTSERVVGFFEREGLARVGPEVVPASKWRDYDPERRARVCCLRVDLPGRRAR